MFDSLLNTKFYNKCKHAFKCVRTRMGPIRRKKHAMIRFMKKDVADLLANGLDTHAFGRMDGLIVELNHSHCYDMIEQFCDEIGKQLGSLQKQRECPPETREAVSTLIFAAARFPDLPELCDLRLLFTERYGNFVEHFVSLEFVHELDSKEFTNEEKFRVMQTIADEFSVSFDAKKLEFKLWATPETEYDMQGLRKQVESAMPSPNKQKCNKDALCERKDKDILQNRSSKPAEPPMPSSNKQNYEKKYEAAPVRRNEKVGIQLNTANAQAVPVGRGQFDEHSRKHQPEKSDEKEHLEKPVPPVATKRRNTQAVPDGRGQFDENSSKHQPEKSDEKEHLEKPVPPVDTKRRNTQAVPDGRSQFDENSRKHQSEKSDEKEHLEKPVPPVDTKRRNIPKDVKKINRKDDRPSEKELMEAVELDLNGLPKQRIVAAKFPETESNKIVQVNAKPKEIVKDHVEKENKEALRYRHRSRIPGGPDHNGRHTEPDLRAQDLENKGSPVTPSSGNTRNKVPPYAKLNGANTKNHTDKPANNVLNDSPQHFVDLGHPVQKGQGVTERPSNMRPPYVKPKSTVQPVNGDPEKRTPRDYSKHNIPVQVEHLDDKDVLRPVSVRRRHAKQQAPVDAYVGVPNKEKVTSQTPSSHARHSGRQNGADHHHSGNGTDGVVGNGKNVQRAPSTQPKHAGRRNGTVNRNNDYDDGFMRHRQLEEDVTAIDFGNLLPRHASAQRRHKSGCNGDLDEEERMMDKLLMHYSKKGLDPSNKAANDSEAQIDSQQKLSLHAPGRAISLPPECAGQDEDVKVPARSTSLQPDCSRAVRVHPRMPDFDELAARVNALRNA
ncbi:hypothetical protein EJB05_42017 [Eragrostis curvula]|uniref:Regulator of Vps4 activity in the MVB pathway protein n=1 Tax=Eragrostis curvula TaxID=38414 RepID=A0A5J9TC93_9POAL|nr:hypothetical protein EJB05_42017 [Eragrostis curvula]